MADLIAPFTWGSGGEALTPDDQKRRRLLAEALMAKGLDTSPVQHWTQGLARVAQALSGNIAASRIDAEEAAARKAGDADAASLFSSLGGGMGGAATPQANAGGALPSFAKAEGGAPSGSFGSIAPKISADLQRDFGLTPEQTAGIVGNLAHESGGFKSLQEQNPLVPGSRGGFGYAQWTGPRRVAFESWSKQNGLDPTSYDANYGFLKHELSSTPEGRVLDSLKQAPDAQTATRVFSDQFLRPGIPAMDSRMRWTGRALGAPPVQMAQASPQGRQTTMTDAGPEVPLPPRRPVEFGGQPDPLPVPAGQYLAGRQQAKDAQIATGGLPQAQAPVAAPAPQQPSMASPMASGAAGMSPERLAAFGKVLNNPYTSPGTKAVAQALLNKALSQETRTPAQIEKEQLELMKLRNDTSGEGYQLDVQQKRLAIEKGRKDLQDKPDFREIGKDAFGNPIMGFVDARSGKVTPYQPPQNGQPATVPGPDGKPVIVPEGLDPKAYRETLSKRAAENAAGPKSDDVTGIRKEVQSLPSYKNITQAVPIYRAMTEAAGRDSKAADLNLVYGLGKIMDPTSVVREGEMVMVNKTAGLPEWLVGAINGLNGGARLTPETRKAIMAEAHGRMQSYSESYNQDAQFYRGIVGRQGMKAEDVLPDFGTFAPWTPQAAAPQAVTPNSGAQAVRPPAAPTEGWTEIAPGVRIREKR